MVAFCALASCKNNKREHKNYAFFMVPKDPTIRRKWQEFAKWKEVKDYYYLSSILNPYTTINQ
ncbi:hypothetical protein ABEB36_015158 [Hypothenemus hampei]|uniref:THAP-type domain-containing protein n=1 Tax=Hypothenemus hampei TaxID=57062 RepID=A0ABD1E558_HYPHA